MGPGPLRLSGERAEGARRADRGEHTGGLPRFGPRWTRKTLLLLGCIELGSSGAWRASCTERMVVWVPNLRTSEPPLRCTRASFYSAKGSPTGVNVGERGKSVKRGGSCNSAGTVVLQCGTVLSYLLLTVGDKGIKCPSRSPGQHRGGPLGAPPSATMAAACRRMPQAARCLATCPRGKPRSDAWAGELERSLEVAILPRQVACRGGRLPVPDSVPAIRPCRGAWRATAGFSCGAWVRPSRQAPLVGGSVVPASSSCRGLVFSARQAPLAGGLVLYAWSSLGASRGGPCRGVLRLPVHKSGVLRYP